jgi:tetratricopeptide (TPR) repeat protein
VKTALLLLLSAVVLLPQDPKTVSLAYKDGEAVTAQVLAVEGDYVRLKVLVLGGQMQVKRKLEDFTTASVFVIEREAKNPEGFDAHFQMAKRAAELGLVPQAGRECRAAVESIKGKPEEAAKTKEVRTWAADALEKLLREALTGGRVQDAEHYLKLISTRLPECRTEEQLEELATAVDSLKDKDIAKKETARQSKLAANARTEIDRRLKPIKKQVEDGDKKQREAVRKSRYTVESANLCDKAIDLYRKAWKELEALVAKYPDDGDLATEVASLGAHLHDNAIRAALHAANMLTVQSDYKGAMEWANKILAYDPDNAEAKEMVRTIQVAQAAAAGEWGWGWRTAGGSGGLPQPDPRGN